MALGCAHATTRGHLRAHASLPAKTESVGCPRLRAAVTPLRHCETGSRGGLRPPLLSKQPCSPTAIVGGPMLRVIHT